MKIVTNEIDKTRKTCTDFHRVAWTYSHDNQKELNSVFHLISKDIPELSAVASDGKILLVKL